MQNYSCLILHDFHIEQPLQFSHPLFIRMAAPHLGHFCDFSLSNSYLQTEHTIFISIHHTQNSISRRETSPPTTNADTRLPIHISAASPFDLSLNITITAAIHGTNNVIVISAVIS